MANARWMKRAALVAILVGGLAALVTRPAHAQSTLNWQPSLEEARRAATQSNRLILVHFWAPWCKDCGQLDYDVFAQPQVQQEIEAKFVAMKLNVDDYPTTAKQYGVDRLPTDLIITPAGKIVGRMRSPLTPEAYLQQLAIAASGAAGPTTPVVASAPIAPATGAVSETPVQAVQPPSATPAATAYSPVSSPALTATAPMAPPAQPDLAYRSPAANTPASVSDQSTPPAVAAYSDQRYAEYLERFAPPPAGAVSAASATAVATGSIEPPPAANPGYPGMANPGMASPGFASAAAPQSPGTLQGAATSDPRADTAAMGQTATLASAMEPPIVSQGTPMAAPPAYASVPAVNAAYSSAPATPAAPLQPGLGMEGYCPVTLAEHKRWQMGDRRYGVNHRGRTYLFAGPAEQQKFLSAPDRYSPAISGTDPVLALDAGQAIDGKRQFGVEYQNRVYLFSSEASRRTFSENPKRYVTEVLQAEAPARGVLR